MKNDQVADAMVPLGLSFTMLSNAFAPTGGMPGRLRFLADWSLSAALLVIFVPLSLRAYMRGGGTLSAPGIYRPPVLLRIVLLRKASKWRKTS